MMQAKKINGSVAHVLHSDLERINRMYKPIFAHIMINMNGTVEIDNCGYGGATVENLMSLAQEIKEFKEKRDYLLGP